MAAVPESNQLTSKLTRRLLVTEEATYAWASQCPSLWNKSTHSSADLLVISFKTLYTNLDFRISLYVSAETLYSYQMWWWVCW